MIFVPSSQIETTPDQLGLTHEEVWLQVNKKEHLHGWWIPAKNPDADVILYLHGNGENIGGNLGHTKRFQELGFSVFLVDYRGYGRSHQRFPHEEQVYHDAQIAYNYLIQKRQIKPENLIIYGHSLGGAIAIDLAVKNRAAGLIVEASFTSMRDMVDHKRIYRIFPIDIILHQKFDSLSKIKFLQMPLLITHGTDDQTIPVEMGNTLFEAAQVPKKILIVPYAGHNNIASVAGEEYLKMVGDFSHLVRSYQEAY